MIGNLDPETLRANERVMKKRGKVIGIAMMAGSIALTLVFGFLAYRSFERYSWSETQGTVTRSEYNRSAATDETRAYYEYEYSVNGITYQGKDSDRGASVSVDQPPAQGASITVYYDPEDPAESLVDTNKSNALSDAAMWGLCCGPIFFLFGVVFLFVSTRPSQIQG